MINYRRNFLILGSAFAVWAFMDLDYNSKEPESLDRMLKWSPFSAQSCMSWINAAGENPRLTNLHGLNCPEIYKVALQKRKSHFDAAIAVYEDAIRSTLDKKLGANVYYKPYSNMDATIHNPNAPASFTLNLSHEDLHKRLAGVVEGRDIVTRELDRFLPQMPWTKKFALGDIPGTPVRYEISGLSNDRSQPIATKGAESIISETDRKLMGDRLDDAPDATPNTAEDAADKAAGKPWQDNNGFMHFPDGSITNGPVD